MNTFVGVTVVDAAPMTRLLYCQLRGWNLPADEDGGDPGYLVEDLTQPANTSSYMGYVTWMPKLSFEKTHRDCDNEKVVPLLKSYNDWQAEIIQEAKELRERIEGLSDILNYTKAPDDSDAVFQFNIMVAYFELLVDRIKDFEK